MWANEQQQRQQPLTAAVSWGMSLNLFGGCLDWIRTTLLSVCLLVLCLVESQSTHWCRVEILLSLLAMIWEQLLWHRRVAVAQSLAQLLGTGCSSAWHRGLLPAVHILRISALLTSSLSCC
jgi:hypothetical protein